MPMCPSRSGAVFPLVRTQEETRLEECALRQGDLAGRMGPAVDPHRRCRCQRRQTNDPKPHGPYDIPPLPEGQPTIKPIDEDAAHFLVRQVRAHPHQVTIYAAGPLTNIALAISIDPEFASLTQGIVLMGGSLNPQTTDPEFATDPRHEFNFWFDPEAAHIVLRADWPRIDVTTDDISVKAPFTQQMLDAITKSSSPAARYIAAWSQHRTYMWDELDGLRLARSRASLPKKTDLHGRGPQPRPQLRRHAHLDRGAQARHGRPPGARADRPRPPALPEALRGFDDPHRIVL